MKSDQMPTAGILLLSHGTLCEGVLDAMRILGCDTEQIQAIPLDMESELDAYTQQVSQAIDALDNGGGVLVIVDLLGGTPFNRACMLREEKNIEVLAGMSLPMCISALDFRRTEALVALAETCKREAKEAVINVKDLL